MDPDTRIPQNLEPFTRRRDLHPEPHTLNRLQPKAAAQARCHAMITHPRHLENQQPEPPHLFQSHQAPKTSSLNPLTSFNLPRLLLQLPFNPSSRRLLLLLDVGIGGDTSIAGQDASLFAPRRGVGLLRVQGSGFRVQGSGFRVQGSGFGI